MYFPSEMALMAHSSLNKFWISLNKQAGDGKLFLHSHGIEWVEKSLTTFTELLLEYTRDV